MKGQYLCKIGRNIFAHVDQVGANTYKYYPGKPSDKVQFCTCSGDLDYVMRYARDVIEAYCYHFGLKSGYKICYVAKNQ